MPEIDGVIRASYETIVRSDGCRLYRRFGCHEWEYRGWNDNEGKGGYYIWFPVRDKEKIERLENAYQEYRECLRKRS